jgi:hypothetical protein
MPDGILRVEGLQHLPQPFPTQAAGHQRREPGHRADPYRLPGPQVVVQAQLRVGVPAGLQAVAAPLRPGRDLGQLLDGGADDLAYAQQGLVGGDEDGAEEHVLDEERVGLVDLSPRRSGRL